MLYNIVNTPRERVITTYQNWIGLYSLVRLMALHS